MPKSAEKQKPPHISQEDWDAVDSPELSDEFIRRMRPASEVVPDIVKAYREGKFRRKAEKVGVEG